MTSYAMLICLMYITVSLLNLILHTDWQFDGKDIASESSGAEGEIWRKLFVGVSHRSWHTSSLLISFTLCRNGLLLLIVVATCVAT